MKSELGRELKTQMIENPKNSRSAASRNSVDRFVLHLVLTHHWFDEIDSGRKRIEYREMTEYWEDRIWNKRDKITHVQFSRGYTPIKSPIYEVECIDVGESPYTGWTEKYFRIHFKQNASLRD